MIVSMLTDIRKLDNKLSNNFKNILATAIAMLFLAITGGIVAFFLSYNIGHIIVLAAVVIGNICIITCIILRILGKHLKKE